MEASEDGPSFLGLTATKLAVKVNSNPLYNHKVKRKAAIRSQDESKAKSIVLRSDLCAPQPALKLAHYYKPNFVTTQYGLHPQTLSAQKDLTADRATRAYTDSESDMAPTLTLDAHRIFDFNPKTPQEADIQNHVNSVPSLKQLNELRKYKLGVHPDKKFRLMLSTAPAVADATTQFVKDYIIEADKERRSVPYLDGMNVNPNKTAFVSRMASPSALKPATESRLHPESETSVVKPNIKYGNSIRLAPAIMNDPLIQSKMAGDGNSIASLESTSTHRSSSPIYSPATFRVPVPLYEDKNQLYGSNVSKDTGATSYPFLSSAEEIPGLSCSHRRNTENSEETANRLFAMRDSDSFQDSRREQFLRDSLIEDSSTNSLIQQIRVTSMPGRTRVPKKYNHFIEELDSNVSQIRASSRQQRIRSKSPHGRLHDAADPDYEALQRTGTARGQKLKCSNCYVQATLWCTSCIQAFCLACWNSVPHHTLYNMVPAFPNRLSKRYKGKFQNVLSETQTKYLDPAPAVSTGKREFERPPPPMVPTSPDFLNIGVRPRSDVTRNQNNRFSSRHPDEFLTELQWSPPASPNAEELENDKSFSPKVLFASKKASRTAAAAQAIEQQLHHIADTEKVFDGNALPAKMPVVNQATVQYQDYAIPGVVLTGKGQILELTDEFSDSAAPNPGHRVPTGSRPGTGKRSSSSRRPLSAERPGIDTGFEGEVKNTIRYVLPSSNVVRMDPLGVTTAKPAHQMVIPSGFDNSSPHKQLVRKITREGARNLQRKGDTRSFSPSFSLGTGGNGGKGMNVMGNSSSSNNIAATISRPSTVARPMTGITNDLVFPSSTSAPDLRQEKQIYDDSFNWKDGNFHSQEGKSRIKKISGPPTITIYDGVPVFTLKKSLAEKLGRPGNKLPPGQGSSKKMKPLDFPKN